MTPGRLDAGLSPFEEMVIGLSLKSEEIIMALWAYFDESGHPKEPATPFFSMGGCIASVDHFREFDKNWLRILGAPQYGLQAFHMVDWVHGRNAFKGWSQKKRDGLLEKLFHCMDEYIASPRQEHGYIGYVRCLPDPRPDIETVYYDAFRVCAPHAALFGHHEQVHFVFAKQEEIKVKTFTDYYGMVSEVFEQNARLRGRLGGVAVWPAKECAMLQAADIVAYELRKRKERRQPVVYVPLRENQCRFWGLH